MRAPLALFPLLAVAGALILATPSGAGSFPWQQPGGNHYDLLIRGGLIVDGTGNPERPADLGIRGDTIVAVGRLTGATAERVIDASGLMVTPGFIDMHSHANGALGGGSVANRRAPNLVRQGITTVVFGADGRSGWPISADSRRYAEPGTAMNVIPMVGHGAVRSRAMSGTSRAARPGEIERMKELVRQGMEEGAWGIGAGPEYSPGRYSTTEELIEVCKVAAEYDGFYYAHQRSQSRLPRGTLPSQVRGPVPNATDGMKETIRLAVEAGLRTVGSHIKRKGVSEWGGAYTDTTLINLARREGHQVYLDIYPYDHYDGGASSPFPGWASRGGADALRERLADPETLETLMTDLAYSIDVRGGPPGLFITNARDNSLVGKTVQDLMRERGVSPEQVLIDLELDNQNIRVRPIAMSEMDVEQYMRQDYTAYCTDGGVTTATSGNPGPHPRTTGTFPRVIAEYVKRREVITLPHAVRGMTSLGAQIIGLPDRGFLMPGYKADVVVFDYDELDDRATIMQPRRPPVGLKYVLNNGEFLMDNEQLTGALAGRVLNRAEIKGNARLGAAPPAFPLQPVARGAAK